MEIFSNVKCINELIHISRDNNIRLLDLLILEYIYTEKKKLVVPDEMLAKTYGCTDTCIYQALQRLIIKELVNYPTVNEEYLLSNSGNEFIEKLIAGKKKKISVKEEMEMFNKFWSIYPVKKGKSNALKAWKKLNINEGLFKLIIDGLNKEMAYRNLNKNKSVFIPEWMYPQGWINQKRWEDEWEVDNVYNKPKYFNYDR